MQEKPDKDFKPIRILGVENKPYSDEPEAVVERLQKRPVVVNLFTDGPDAVFHPADLQSYLTQTFGSNFTVINHGDLITCALKSDPQKKQEIIKDLAEANSARMQGFAISDEEKIKLEEEALKRDLSQPYREFTEEQRRSLRYRVSGIGYYYITDLGNAYSRMIPQDLRAEEEGKRKTFLIITGRGVGEKWGQGIHMRAGFAHGILAAVSTTGLVDAPGKPLDVEKSREWGFIHSNDEHRKKAFMEELAKRGNAINGSIFDEIMKKVYEDKMLHYEDERMNEVVKGICISMILYTLGEFGKAASCSTTDLQRGAPDVSKFCRLHDGHWQEEVIATQVKDKGQPEFCDYHEQIFTKLK